MLNSEIYELKLKRLDICDISLSILGVIFDFQAEIKNPETTETRKEICKQSLEKWENLHEAVKRQLKWQDEERGF